MTGLFYDETHTNYRNIRTARAWYAEHPDGKIKTGCWPDTTWTKEQFYDWYWECLNKKINRNMPTGRKYSNTYTGDLRYDKRIIEDNLHLRHNRAGTNILRTPELQKRYPTINNNPCTD